VSAEELGGAALHCGTSGVTDHYAQDEAHALAMARDILATANLQQPPGTPPSRYTSATRHTNWSCTIPSNLSQHYRFHCLCTGMPMLYATKAGAASCMLTGGSPCPAVHPACCSSHGLLHCLLHCIAHALLSCPAYLPSTWDEPLFPAEELRGLAVDPANSAHQSNGGPSSAAAQQQHQVRKWGRVQGGAGAYCVHLFATLAQPRFSVHVSAGAAIVCCGLLYAEDMRGGGMSIADDALLHTILCRLFPACLFATTGPHLITTCFYRYAV
jgi:hypothetical protein